MLLEMKLDLHQLLTRLQRDRQDEPVLAATAELDRPRRADCTRR
jgi:hypothetical protein